MDQIVKIFLAGYETFLLIFFLDTLMFKKNELKKERKIAFFLYFVFQCVTYLIDFPFFSTSYAYIAFTLLISWIFYSNENRIKFVSSSMFVTLNYASKLLAVSIFYIIQQFPMSSNPFNYVLNGKTQMLACVIMTLVILIIIGMRKIKDQVMRVIIDILIFILPLSILYMSMHLLDEIGVMNLYFNITMILFCYTFLLFFIIDQLIFSNYNLTQSQLMQERLQMQGIYYQDMEAYNQNMSRYKHDMMNHLNSIYGMLEKGDIEETKKYLLSFTANLQSVKPVINTGNSVIDVILNSKVDLAKKNNISCHNNIVVPPDIDIDSVDLSIILSNLLDNAIEANLKISSQRFIDTNIHIYKNSLFISVKNSFNGQIKTLNSTFISTKKNAENHGLGLKNVEFVVHKYNGTLTTEYDQHIFTLSIMLPLEKQKS